ncbi:hypothetical protein Awo_c34730 [Acetobacterium woodii DSM 1030]|uniref:Uncharacterized protein n=1 Tax=Acetobacterium woodii (strain ATCC 29683 / DSM 1030 / JCM 2381 / KCTC 1655 / WB1) TaxID=931626 RepID=H6LC82_ACEWD|nr:hypothetical protein Awo_c04380 [Acetobacterium woodii DSM 1030]AFA50197.1 hypothetical protein Awo_c34730 [Acetobacterium woodii DSM 1030]
MGFNPELNIFSQYGKILNFSCIGTVIMLKCLVTPGTDTGSGKRFHMNNDFISFNYFRDL